MTDADLLHIATLAGEWAASSRTLGVMCGMHGAQSRQANEVRERRDDDRQRLLDALTSHLTVAR